MTAVLERDRGQRAADAPEAPRPKRRFRFDGWLVTGFTGLTLFVFLLPLGYMIVTSLKSEQMITNLQSPILPKSPATFEYEGEVLDIGRLCREWTPPIRRAVVNRDGGCVFPGCDRPPSWCEIHHCWEWEHGGPTCQDNGALLCRRHHSFIHRKKWRVVIDKPRGKPIVLRPDGTPFTITPWRLAS